MCKKGWCVNQGRRSLHEGWGNCLKDLKKKWKRKEEKGNNRRGLKPLTNYKFG